jgi:hypothetical protein
MSADQGGNLRPSLFHRLCKLGNRAIAFTGLCVCDRLGLGGGTGNLCRTDSDGRSFERVGERYDCSRLAPAHAIEQQFGLTIEQLKHFQFQAAVAECHARKVSTVENRNLRCVGLYPLGCLDRGLRHPALPVLFLLAKSLTRSGSNPGK